MLNISRTLNTLVDALADCLALSHYQVSRGRFLGGFGATRALDARIDTHTRLICHDMPLMRQAAQNVSGPAAAARCGTQRCATY